MRIQSTQILRWSFALVLGAALLLFTAAHAFAQTVSSEQTSSQPGATEATSEATAKNETPGAAKEARAALVPVFKDYRGVEIGMKADDVRGKLKDSLKDKSDAQDLYAFSGGETAVIYYDADGQVTAVSVDFPAKSTKAPSVKEVLGEDAEAKQDGSVYSLVRYPEAGYWVAYSRTAGDSPLVTVTIQKMR